MAEPHSQQAENQRSQDVERSPWLKVEKVVYPPQIPVMTKARTEKGAPQRPPDPVMTVNQPMNEQPRILTAMAPQGNPPSKRAITLLIQYRAMPPRRCQRQSTGKALWSLSRFP